MHGYRADRAFDGERPRRDGVLVLVEGSTIVAVEPASVPAPDGVPVTHLTGTTLLPGLVDTHTHLCGDAGPAALDRIPDLPPAELTAVVARAEQQHLAAGVTAVRDLGDHRWAVLDRSRAGGSALTTVASGPPITSVGGHCGSMGGEVSGTRALRNAVRERAERGAGVVKIMASGGILTPGTDVLARQFSVAELRVVVEEAHRLGLPVTAHAHGLPAVEASAEAGVDGIEHFTCLTGQGMRTPPELLERLAAAGTAVCPTLGRLPGIDPPPRVQALMDALGMVWELMLARVGEAYRAGVTLVSGADSGIAPNKPHGLVAHGVADFVAAGLPAAAALASATGVAARACGIGNRTGRLAPGLDADLLLVDGDPLADPAALRSVRLVVSRGREVAGPDRRPAA